MNVVLRRRKSYKYKESDVIEFMKEIGNQESYDFEKIGGDSPFK